MSLGIAIVIAPAGGTGHANQSLNIINGRDARLPASGLEAAIWAAPDETVAPLEIAIAVIVSAPLEA